MAENFFLPEPAATLAICLCGIYCKGKEYIGDRYNTRTIGSRSGKLLFKTCRARNFFSPLSRSLVRSYFRVSPLTLTP